MKLLRAWVNVACTTHALYGFRMSFPLMTLRGAHPNLVSANIWFRRLILKSLQSYLSDTKWGSGKNVSEHSVGLLCDWLIGWSTNRSVDSEKKELVHAQELSWPKIDDVTLDHIIDPGHAVTQYIPPPPVPTNRLADQPNNQPSNQPANRPHDKPVNAH